MKKFEVYIKSVTKIDFGEIEASSEEEAKAIAEELLYEEPDEYRNQETEEEWIAVEIPEGN
jgi:hypothetical protein